MKVISVLAAIALTAVGGCALLDAEPVNPFEAISKETDFVRSGEQLHHIRVSEDKIVGTGRLIKGVDHVRIRIVGRYVGGQVFGDGVFTHELRWPEVRPPFLVALEGMRVGGARRIVVNADLLVVNRQHPSRFYAFANPEKDDDSFRFRIDQSDLEFEVTILEACRPYRMSGNWYFRFYLGCW